MMTDQLDEVTSRQITATSLRTFMRLPVAQRSSVILMDVLGCSLSEVCDVMDFSLPAVKAALHRGRAQLRELAQEADDAPRPLLPERDVRMGNVKHRRFTTMDEPVRNTVRDVMWPDGVAA